MSVRFTRCPIKPVLHVGRFYGIFPVEYLPALSVIMGTTCDSSSPALPPGTSKLAHVDGLSTAGCLYVGGPDECRPPEFSQRVDRPALTRLPNSRMSTLDWERARVSRIMAPSPGEGLCQDRHLHANVHFSVQIHAAWPSPTANASASTTQLRLITNLSNGSDKTWRRRYVYAYARGRRVF